MKKSLTYYLLLLVLKLKGVKKGFSSAPLDYLKLRKEDVHKPKSKWFRPLELAQFHVLKTLVSEIKAQQPSEELLIFIHGGAYVSGPAQHHWEAIRTIAQQTNLTTWMCDYPKAPEHKITEISENIDAVYDLALEKYDAQKITLIGDSVGGSLIAALTQRLIRQEKPLPHKIILLSPVIDATISNPEIEEVDKIDPMLSKPGVLSAKKMCAANNDLEDVMISPTNGSFKNFPPTILFLAENDLTYPDQQLLVEKLTQADVKFEIILGKEMPHIWPILPVMYEAKLALKEIIKRLKPQ